MRSGQQQQACFAPLSEKKRSLFEVEMEKLEGWLATQRKS